MNAGSMKDVARDEMAPGVDVTSDDDLLEWISKMRRRLIIRLAPANGERSDGRG